MEEEQENLRVVIEQIEEARKAVMEKLKKAEGARWDPQATSLFALTIQYTSIHSPRGSLSLFVCVCLEG